ncbi:hypothetical protein FOA43_000040 [Brettanomyces nanus]|uniref:Uncharacterized protein n=1 Tax=Eeniella nana TaxID=13502 RepID=A0A875RYI6_EENNA|nr:uncharacterized protein FOA43_000040 [Brettanomyces nanus]QPG72739.1 hypothetical protein FOA43_000040 [Brettanomyces nanus]
MVEIRPFLLPANWTHRRYYKNLPKEKRTRFIDEMQNASIHKDEKQVLDIIPATLDDVLGTIPRNSDSRIIYCLSARDFPLSLAKRFFRLAQLRGLNFNNIYYVITMLDSISNNLDTDTFARYKQYYTISLRKFVEELALKMKFDICDDHMFVVSDKVQKPLLQLYESIPLHSCTYYVIGETNSGKSKLSKRLMKLAMKEGKCVKRVDDENGDSKDEDVDSRQNANHFYTVSPSPFRTRKNMTYYAPQFDFTLIDTPGYLQKRNGIFGILNERLRLNLYTQYQVDSAPLGVEFKSPTTTEVFSIGEFFFIKPRGITGFKYRRFMYGKPAVYSRYSAATRKMARSDRLVTPKMRRYLIPPFKGKIDLIFDNMGYIEIDNFQGDGSDYWQIFAPQNIKKLIRIPSMSVSLLSGQLADYAPFLEIPMTVNVQDFISDHPTEM